MQIYHNSHELDSRAPFGALPCGQAVRLRIYVSDEPSAVRLHVFGGATDEWLDMLPGGWGAYEARFFAPAKPALLRYDFHIENAAGQLVRYGAPRDGRGGAGCENGIPYRITVYERAFDPPAYLRAGVMYQIFPDRFFRAGGEKPLRAGRTLHERWDELPLVDPDPRSGDNRALDFFGGDFAGIAQKLPYLADLGVTVLYLNPIFCARTNHRYDTGDYLRTDELLGTNEDFAALCQAARGYGMRILLDGVFSHTGEDSVYFNRYGAYDSPGAYQREDSPYAPWYTFTRFPDEYRCWWGIPTLPEVNKHAPSYREFMLGEGGVVRAWLARGAAGWRLDVADELPVDFLRALYRAAKAENTDAAVLGEVWEDASCKISYGEERSYCLGDMADSVMNYPLREAAIAFLTGACGAGALKRAIVSQAESYPAPFFYSLMNLAGSHDRARIVNVLAGNCHEGVPWAERGQARLTREQYALGVSRYRKLLTLLCALPGIPCVYYGDEIGMQGAADPYCRAPYDWTYGDGALRAFVREKLRERRERRVLQTGTLSLETRGEDVLVVTRRVTLGRDVFGNPARDDEAVVVIDRRA